MEVMHERCCGIDVHKRMLVACLLTPDERGRPRREIRTFGTMTGDLEEMAAWLHDAACTTVAMESTGSYWKPVYNILEGSVELVVVSAQHLKLVPGRKTDVKDAEWIAELLRHGLLRGSFIPGRAERELRELNRYRTSLTRERAAEINRIQKVLEGANIKLASVATDVLGVSGRAMLQAMIEGVHDPAVLAELARGRMREKRHVLEAALRGHLSGHQRFMLDVQLRHIDELDAALQRVSDEIGERLRPFDSALNRLQTIPGVGPRTAQTILVEVGADMTRFPSAGHLASWAGVCPGQRESAGKRQSGKTRHGSPWLRASLVEAARASGRTKGYLGEYYQRLAARRGKKRAAIASAHTILIIAYHLLQDDRKTYEDLGTHYFDTRRQERNRNRLVQRLKGMGYAVTLTPAA